ncbi:MAG: hypothetical protein WDM91_16540 [Rhizomicrobium sp.]
MPSPADFDLAAAHRYFAANCFNRAWDLIEKETRTEEDDRMMVALSYASIFHWANRPDCDNQKLSVGYWQASRVHALIGDPHTAVRLGGICLSYSNGLPPFFVAYAHEALARAHKLMGDRAETERHLTAAHRLLVLVEDMHDRNLLEADLEQLAQR